MRIEKKLFSNGDNLHIKVLEYSYEHILLNYSKGSETKSGNLLVPLLIYNNMPCKL